jgi:hypothetical protein
MSTNFYFQSGNTSGTTAEQRLIEDLIIESLKIYGHDVYYLPRTLVDEDSIFDEDTLSQFTQAYPLEMYLENVDGFEGDGDLFTKFGIEIRDKATFVLAKRRWEDMVLTSDGTFQLDARPAEGDLLYFEKTGSIFEIKYVDFQNPFYQIGKIFTFKLECELFEYSSEVIDTGIASLDTIYEEQNLDMLVHQLELETGSLLLTEDGGCIITEDYAAQKSSANTDNTNFVTEEQAGDILDFSEINPFGEVGS